ncbi:MAG: replication-relaxation family protein [Pseudomonadota bacterium]
MPMTNMFGGLHFQNRDLAILRGLFESRIMTSIHLAALYFDGRKEAAKKRLQKLKAAGLIGERKRRVYEPSVLFLTRKALTFLREQGVLSEYPQLGPFSLEKRAHVSNLTIQHELEIMDVKTAFHAAISKTPAFTIAEFSTWPLLYQFEACRPGHEGREVVVKPDGFIRIHEKEPDGGLSEHTYFLEVDRSSETQDTLVARAGCYLNYYKSGGFAEWNGAQRSEYKDFPFRILMVFKNAERRNNTAERLLQNIPPILTQTCLSTLEEVTTDPLGAIWTCPADYRDATKGTAFDTAQRRTTYGYKRQPVRENLVERMLKKSRILSDNTTVEPGATNEGNPSL